MKLDIGAGCDREDGWVSLDINPEAAPDVVDDATKLESIPDDSCEQIRAIHLIEHLYHFQVAPTLELWFRKLSPGGILTLYIPDIFTEMERFLLRDDHPDRFFAIVYGKQWSEDPAAIHKTAFWPDRIVQLLRDAGFQKIRSTPPRYDTEFAVIGEKTITLYTTEET